jgi:hypothetical protein
MAEPKPEPNASPSAANPQSDSNDPRFIAKEYGANYQSSTSGGVKDPMVYLGMLPHTEMPGSSSYYTAIAQGQYDNTMKLSEASQQYYNWDDKTKNKFLSQLNLAGYDTSKMLDSQAAQLWAGYAEQAGKYYASGSKMTPWDILAKDRMAREKYMNTPRTVNQTSTSYDMSTRGDAHAIFLQAAQSLLGRDPTKSEITSFQRALNDYEKAHPTVTTTTSNYLGDQLQSQTSTTKGGVKEGARQIMATEDVKADP